MGLRLGTLIGKSGIKPMFAIAAFAAKFAIDGIAKCGK